MNGMEFNCIEVDVFERVCVFLYVWLGFVCVCVCG